MEAFHSKASKIRNSAPKNLPRLDGLEIQDRSRIHVLMDGQGLDGQVLDGQVMDGQGHRDKGRTGTREHDDVIC